jgi:hypothetical protein
MLWEVKMEYGKNEHELYQEGKLFTQAIHHKLGHPTQTENPQEVINALKLELQEKIKNDKLRVFEGIYGWAYTVKYGQAGEVKMLAKEDLA